MVEETNQDPRRGYGHENVLTTIKLDDHTDGLLEKMGMTINSVPAAGEGSS